MTKDTTQYDRYYVTNWLTNRVYSEHTSLAEAKRQTRALGPEYDARGRYTGPVAYVGVKESTLTGEEIMCCLYRPRFPEAEAQ